MNTLKALTASRRQSGAIRYAFSLGLRREGSVRIYLKANGFMPGKISFDESGAYTCEWVQHHARAMRVAADCIFDEVLRISSNPRYPTMDGASRFATKAGSRKGAFIDPQSNLSAHASTF